MRQDGPAGYSGNPCGEKLPLISIREESQSWSQSVRLCFSLVVLFLLAAAASEDIIMTHSIELCITAMAQPRERAGETTRDTRARLGETVYKVVRCHLP